MDNFREFLTCSTEVELADFLRNRPQGDRLRAVLPELCSLACGSPATLPDLSGVEAEDRFFLDQLLRATRGDAADKAGASSSTRGSIGPELDFLAHTCFSADMTAAQSLLLANRLRHVPTRSVCAVLMARNEGVYLIEWLAHYMLLGVEHFYIYTNDNDDGSDELLDSLLVLGNVTVIDNVFANGTNPQRKVFQHAVTLLDGIHAFEWAMFIDADEFLDTGNGYGTSVQALIENACQGDPASKPVAIRLPWRVRFREPTFQPRGSRLIGEYDFATIPVVAGSFKSIIRLSHVVGMCEVHAPSVDADAAFVNSDGGMVEYGKRWDAFEPDYQGPTLDHFWAKTFVDFIVKKSRGDTLQIVTGQFQRDYDQFFDWTPAAAEEFRSVTPPAKVAELGRKMRDILESGRVAIAGAAVQQRYVDRNASYAADPEVRELFTRLMSARGYTDQA